MYTVRGNGIVWDPDAGEPLAKFTGGIFITEDRAVAEKLKAMGYQVAGEEKKSSVKSKTE